MSLTNQLGRFLRAALYHPDGDRSPIRVGIPYTDIIRAEPSSGQGVSETPLLGVPASPYWILGAWNTGGRVQLKKGSEGAATGPTEDLFLLPATGTSEDYTLSFALPLRVDARITFIRSGQMNVSFTLFYVNESDIKRF